jgi:putative two-component system response regulator
VEKPRVLLVDDNDATCTLITALLQREFSVEVAIDGSEAIEKLKTREYAAILLDLLMPVVDGYGVLDYLQAERPELLQRVLVVTASLSAREMQRVRGYDVCGVIGKPFEVEHLLAAVQQCAASSGQQFSRGLVTSGMILLLAEMIVRRA